MKLLEADWYRLWRDKTPEELEAEQKEREWWQRYLAGPLDTSFNQIALYVGRTPVQKTPQYPMIVDEAYTWEHRQHNNTNAKKKPSLRRRGWK